VATLPHIPHDTLALSLGESRSLSEITPDQMRRFADTARIPVSPLWPIVAETAERTLAAWERLEEKELLPGDMRVAVGKHILAVTAKIRENPPR
jgi:serine/threonine-protein kinase HipA